MTFECAQDVREKELLKQGYVNPEKAFFRIGRAIFVVDILSKEFTEEEAVGTPIGLAAAMNKPDMSFDQEMLDWLQNAFGSTGYLRIICEGDPDCGFAGNYEILLTGYRGGLDDVIVDRKLLQTVHGSDEDIMRNFAEWLHWQADWVNKPNWETYEGDGGYYIQPALELEEKIRAVSDAVKELAEELEHKDDMPDWVKVK